MAHKRKEKDNENDKRRKIKAAGRKPCAAGAVNLTCPGLKIQRNLL